MQVSRNWRLRAQRYRLQGFRRQDGKLSLQRRPLVTVSRRQAIMALPAPVRV